MDIVPNKLRRRSECGSPWTEDEWETLVRLHSENKPLEDIAKNLSRTTITIRFAIKEITESRITTPPSSQSKINRFINDRNIRKLIHFTAIDNIKNIRKNGLLSVNNLKRENIEFLYNDLDRFDERGGVCLSITTPNRYLIRQFTRRNRDIEWAIIEIDPSILETHDCLFFDTNASFAKFRSRSEKELSNFSSLSGMFKEEIENKNGILKRGSRKYNETTCEQAEVIVKKNIPVSKILRMGSYNG
jgi:hypothetical protein